MSKLLHSRVFRFLVCSLVICCILVNCSPIKAEATTVVASGLSLSAVLAWLLSAALGIVAFDLTVESLNRIGDNYKEVALSGADSATISAYENLEDNFVNYLSSVQFDRNQWAEDLYTVFNSDTMKNTASWLVDVVKMGGYELDGDSVPDGWAFYGELLFPIIPTYDEYPFVRISSCGNGEYTVHCSNVPLYSETTSLTTSWFMPATACEYIYATVYPARWDVTTTYSFHDPISISKGKYVLMSGSHIWSNYDVFCYKDNSLVHPAGAEPKYKYSEVITPTYVGDIPQNIIEGKENEETLSIPIVDPLSAIATPATAREDINALIAGLKNGTITLDDYLEKVRAEAITTTPDATTAPGTDSESGTTTDTWTPPADPSGFALDLSGIFPFCIPFDLYDFLCCLDAPPEAPVIEWEIALPGGGSYPLLIDLSPFDSVAQLLRRLQLLLFIVALAIKTRDLIKG